MRRAPLAALLLLLGCTSTPGRGAVTTSAELAFTLEARDDVPVELGEVRRVWQGLLKSLPDDPGVASFLPDLAGVPARVLYGDRPPTYPPRPGLSICVRPTPLDARPTWYEIVASDDGRSMEIRQRVRLREAGDVAVTRDAAVPSFQDEPPRHSDSATFLAFDLVVEDYLARALPGWTVQAGTNNLIVTIPLAERVEWYQRRFQWSLTD